ncbi:MAG: cell envelope integrity protein CreD [Bacteroidales bacterium]|nr:cell envelope integrity protein CreD [Bacteroidales bacterium]
METKNIQQFMNSYSVKMILVGGLALVLLIPSFLIQNLIQERITLSEQVKKELYSQWGEKQVIAGPVLNVPFTVTETGEDSQKITEQHGVAHFLPESLKTDGSLYPETRKRGIYKVVVYQGKVNIKGSFVQPDVSQFNLPNAQYHWEAAYFTLGISDMRGIKNLPELIVNDQHCIVEPGVADTDLFPSGITVKAGSMDVKQPLDFNIELVLNSSESLSVETLGKISDVTMKSDWTQPSFTGGFLPENRNVTDTGFTANWRVTHLNRNFPQQWIGTKYTTHEATLGVELLLPVNHYQLSMRSVKYAILFIALNFLVLMFIEIKSKTRIHPFQYSLVAFALLIFYALLTSIGEQTGFNAAYVISAAAVTSLISWYSFSIVHDKRMVGQITLLQIGLYSFLFALLQLQDYALLAGSIGLFVILAILMRTSRQIKWDSEV